MENKKTLEYLNSKAWYRTLKVVYLFFVIYCYLMAVMGFMMYFYESAPILFKVFFIPVAIFLAWVASQIPKWIFYYIYFGKIKPVK